MACDSSAPEYDVCLVEDLLGSNSCYMAQRLAGRRSLVVTTPTVERIYGARLRSVLASWELAAEELILACDETSKSPQAVLDVCRAAIEFQLGRQDVLVAFGGGVCSDIVTLAASLLRRGIAHVRIPTTLTGQVDAGIGVKGGVNFCNRKNILGCFHPPEEVLIDPAFLQSLGRSELSAGFAEIIKMAIICDRELFDEVATNGMELLTTGFVAPRESSRNIIWRSCQLMLCELAPNIYEDQSYQRLVDFGHTFSPKLESLSGYRVPHGHAVALDMVLSSAISRELGALPMDEFEAIVHALKILELPIHSPLFDVETCMQALREAAHHRGGSANLVIPARIGSATFIQNLNDLPSSLIRQALDNLSAVVEALP